MSLCGTDDKRTNKQLKIELLSQWKLEAEFRNSSDLTSYYALLNPPHMSMRRRTEISAVLVVNLLGTK